MWIMLPTGALSIVMRNHPETGPDYAKHCELQVRSRRREWLDAFRAYCPEMTESIHVQGRDYQWRGFVTREDLAAALARVALDGIQYSNFKNAVMSPEFGLKDAKLSSSYHSACHKVWDIMLEAGDGTSCFDYKAPASKYTGTGSINAGYGTIEICRTDGHFFRKGEDACTDCGMTRKQVKGHHRPSQTEVDTWYRLHPEVVRPGQKVSKPMGTPKQASLPVKSAAESAKVFMKDALGKAIDQIPF